MDMLVDAPLDLTKSKVVSSQVDCILSLPVDFRGQIHPVEWEEERLLLYCYLQHQPMSAMGGSSCSHVDLGHRETSCL